MPLVFILRTSPCIVNMEAQLALQDFKTGDKVEFSVNGLALYGNRSHTSDELLTWRFEVLGKTSCSLILKRLGVIDAIAEPWSAMYFEVEK